MGKHRCKISKNTYFEENLRTAAFELTLCSGCLELDSVILQKYQSP